MDFEVVERLQSIKQVPLLSLLSDACAAMSTYGAGQVSLLAPGSSLVEVNKFLAEQMTFHGQQYLRSEEVIQIIGALTIEERSAHFVVRQEGAIVAILRATPYPFELSRSTEQLRDEALSLSSYLEFSRLYVRQSAMARVWVGPMLLASAAEWAILNGFEGLVALSKMPQKRLYERFGLRPRWRESLVIPMRQNGEYWLMRGRWSEMYNSIKRLNIVSRVGLDSTTYDILNSQLTTCVPSPAFHLYPEQSCETTSASIPSRNLTP
jgi:hypothetical protein